MGRYALCAVLYASCGVPDSRDGFPAVTTLSPFEVNLSSHIPGPLDNLLFTFGQKVFSASWPGTLPI